MLPNLTVRSAQISDRNALNELVKNIGPQCVVALSGGRVFIDVEQTLVAVQGDCVIGFVAWLQDEMQAVIVGLGVRDTHRRFGVATRLVNALIECLREVGVRLLEAVVPRDRVGAIGVFESVGFRRLGRSASNCVTFEYRLWGRRNRADGFA
ncbi:MAG: GNAT family N-acetyltransferase [Gemmatimonadetes bacterium]|nr:GNAT family N-acetyltransferase [Gemmatimonadota bacterium]MYK50704.1 GNAT family N-acetyltransferase [Gemmatimonadota bacterium]